MGRTAGIAATAALLASLGPGSACTQPARSRPVPPQMLLRMQLQNAVRLPLSQVAVTTPHVGLELLGDGKNIVVATGKGPYAPRLFFGLCKGPCGFALRDLTRYFDLMGRASIRFTTIVSGFHRVRPVVVLADGTVLIGDRAQGSTADFHRYELSLSDCRWLELDPARGVTLGRSWVEPDLSKVDAVGVFDVIPGSGAWTGKGLPVEKQPPPPAGGWIAVSAFEIWGRPGSRR